MPIYRHGGKILRVAGGLARSAGCCCGDGGPGPAPASCNQVAGAEVTFTASIPYPLGVVVSHAGGYKIYHQNQISGTFYVAKNELYEVDYGEHATPTDCGGKPVGDTLRLTLQLYCDCLHGGGFGGNGTRVAVGINHLYHNGGATVPLGQSSASFSRTTTGHQWRLSRYGGEFESKCVIDRNSQRGDYTTSSTVQVYHV